jgi:glutathione S-transferase
MRARLAMYYSKINYEHREISLKNRPRELYNISSKGTVPVLELQSGKVIDESFEIMKWAISLNDPKKWFYNSKEKQLEAILVNDSHFKKWLDKYKYHVRYPDYEKSFYRLKCEKILDKYEKTLMSSDNLFGNQISLGDIALLPFIRQFANVDINRFNEIFVNLSKWLEKLVQLDIFNNMMKKFDIWENGNEPNNIIFDD